jgi:hypothetical protein
MQPCTSGRDLGGFTDRLSNYQDMAMCVYYLLEEGGWGDVGMYSYSSTFFTAIFGPDF